MASYGWVVGPIFSARTNCKIAKRPRTELKCVSEQVHIPVLLDEVVALFEGRKHKVFIDGTVGAGGHAAALMKYCDIDLYIGLDQDANALSIARENLSEFGHRVKLIQANFRQIPSVLTIAEVESNYVDGILLDIGVSSMQIDNSERGFSFIRDGPLDMRMNQEEQLTAAEVVNTYPEDELGRIFREYGEEPQHRRMSQKVIEFRKDREISTTYDLIEAVCGAKWANGQRPSGYPFKIHPATRVFQALRIFVNHELEVLEETLPDAIDLLRPGSGRMGVITFHSLEDRIVKKQFRESAKLVGGVRDLTKKPIIPSDEECRDNPRSRSAKLRAIERLGEDEKPKTKQNKYRQSRD